MVMMMLMTVMVIMMVMMTVLEDSVDAPPPSPPRRAAEVVTQHGQKVRAAPLLSGGALVTPGSGLRSTGERSGVGGPGDAGGRGSTSAGVAGAAGPTGPGAPSRGPPPASPPPAAGRARVKEQIRIIVEDLELVLGDLKDVARELKEVVDQIDTLTSDLQLEEEMTDSSRTDTLNSSSSGTTASSLEKTKERARAPAPAPACAPEAQPLTRGPLPGRSCASLGDEAAWLQLARPLSSIRGLILTGACGITDGNREKDRWSGPVLKGHCQIPDPPQIPAELAEPS
ncbi:PREDICTED: protein Largen [Dipodomys ordii]|uniref:Protein Largen n=1 Tax=Dipodomys ordii TaxID=10020 RepID=A0A1S3F2Z4_DIPOR|nr:PREDICTED: protein Largen [Dipodomys ordii]